MGKALLILAFLVAGSFEPGHRDEETPRDAGDSLRTLSSEEADFRGCDRDSNRVNDFWTADVSGLYRMTSATVLNPGTDGAIRVIEFSVASESDEESPDWTSNPTDAELKRDPWVPID